MKISDALEGIGRSVSYYPGLRKLCGSVSATVLFCQLFYWKGKESSEDGWIYKDSSELEEETGLSYKEQVSARKKLAENGLIEEKYDRLAHKMYFRIMVNSLNDQWEVPETTDGKFGKRPMVSSSIHKITTENTTDILQPAEDDGIAECESFDSEEYIRKMQESKSAHIRLIGSYFTERGVWFPDKKTAQDEVRRWTKDAAFLVKYGTEKVDKAWDIAKRKYPDLWNLSTVRKIIPEA